MTPTLEVVRAGAGSGKTTDLCQKVADAVSGGLDPARVLAMTFTKKAAGELKSRIQAKLLSENTGGSATRGRVDRLELAAIGTVHSVAHQLLSRYAIEMGLSPRLEVLTEQGSKRTLDNLLVTISTSGWKPLADLAERLGIDDMHQRVLSLLAVRRGNLISEEDFLNQMEESANRLCELLAPDGVLEKETSIGALYEVAEEALAKIDNLVNDTTDATDKARQKIRQLRSNRISHWGKYLEAVRIEAGKRSGANGMLDDLRDHASRVRKDSGLHKDIRNLSILLANEVIRIDSEYDRYKRERGMVDFTDLEVLLLRLLQDEELATRIAGDFDLVLVDEFQDTNPIQLAIFQRFRNLSPLSRWVGDPKQAIYGFRDTDPDLVNDVWSNTPEAARETLPNNHRSQRGLVQFIGKLFAPLLGDDAIQVPQKPAKPGGIERWFFGTRNQSDDAVALSSGIATLHQEGVRFGDIVVLARTNDHLRLMASALDSLKIPYLLGSAGLFSTREGVMLLSGLRLVADRSDSLAAATVLNLLADPSQDTPGWVVERLESLRNSGGDENEDAETYSRIPWEGDTHFSRIEEIDRSIQSPTHIAQGVIEALDLPILVQKWGDPARRCSNIDSVLRHAREYEEMALDAGQAPTLSGLILHLEQLAASGLDVRYPPQGHDAVTLITYHSAKGLEWPVVILSDLDTDRSPDMWSASVTGGGLGNANPLEGRTLRSWIWPFGKTEGRFGKLRRGSGLEDDALASPEGQARSERESEESLRLLYVGCTRAREKLVFAHGDGKCSWLEKLPLVDSLLDCSLEDGEHEMEGIETTFILRRLNADGIANFQLQEKETERWISHPEILPSAPYSQRFHSPSRSSSISPRQIVSHEDLPAKPFFPKGVSEDNYSAIGDAVHRYFAALPSLSLMGDAHKDRVARRCLEAYSVSGFLPPNILVACGKHFSAWVENNFPGAVWLTEIPVVAPRSGGGSWNGTIDLILKLPNGRVVIVDHKSAPIRKKDCLTKAEEYSGQISAYNEALDALGESIESMWIHFPLAGVVVKWI